MDLVKHVAPTHPPPDPHTSLKPGQAPSSPFHYIRIRRSPTFPRAKFLLTHHRFVHRQRQPNRKPSLDEGARGAVFLTKSINNPLSAQERAHKAHPPAHHQQGKNSTETNEFYSPYLTPLHTETLSISSSSSLRPPAPHGA